MMEWRNICGYDNLYLNGNPVGVIFKDGQFDNFRSHDLVTNTSHVRGPWEAINPGDFPPPEAFDEMEAWAVETYGTGHQKMARKAKRMEGLK